MKKYQIFISSTYEDLKDERHVVRDAILKLHQFPVGMEQFNAGDLEQWEVIKEAIDSSDYYVVIIGKRYGSVIDSGDDAGISFTEKEFNYANSKDIPILAFIKSDSANFRGDGFETDIDKLQKLCIFTSKVKAGRIVEWFDNSYDLAAKVTAALHNEMEKHARPGWVRGNHTDIESKIDELIKMLKQEFGYDEDDNDAAEDEDWDEPVTTYEFSRPRFPADGPHKEIGWQGTPIAEGEYKDEKLVKGIEYDVLIHVKKGELIFKPDCPQDPYDSTEDFEYERMESYGWGLSFRPFSMSENYIIMDGIEQYYVADMKVDEKTEQMTNIRTLEEFLNQHDPKYLRQLKDLIEMERG